MNTFLNSKERLKNCGIRLSLQRMAILDYLMTHQTHPTADTIFKDLYQNIPTLSKTTVYNTLKLFVEHGAISAINIDEKNVRHDGDITRHSHFRCKHCGCIYDLPITDLQVSHSEKDLENFTITEIQLYYKGFCKNCKN